MQGTIKELLEKAIAEESHNVEDANARIAQSPLQESIQNALNKIESKRSDREGA